MPHQKIFNSRDLIKPFKKYYSKDNNEKNSEIDVMIFCSGINLSLMDSKYVEFIRCHF